MKIAIKRLELDEVEIDPETVFTFPQGLIGFEAHHRFWLLQEAGKPELLWMQSLDDPGLMFSLVSPEMIEVQYQLELSDADCAQLQLERPEDALVLVMVYREAVGSQAEAPPEFNANTRSPIVLNTTTRLGMQKALQEVHPTLLVRAR